MVLRDVKWVTAGFTAVAITLQNTDVVAHAARSYNDESQSGPDARTVSIK